jgi:hypothetical protein
MVQHTTSCKHDQCATTLEYRLHQSYCQSEEIDFKFGDKEVQTCSTLKKEARDFYLFSARLYDVMFQMTVVIF